MFLEWDTSDFKESKATETRLSVQPLPAVARWQHSDRLRTHALNRIEVIDLNKGSRPQLIGILSVQAQTASIALNETASMSNDGSTSHYR